VALYARWNTVGCVGPQPPVPDEELLGAIHAFDRAFLEGQLEQFSAFFANEARLLIHQQEAVLGRQAVRESFASVFNDFDTSAYEPRYEIVDVHGDQAYVLGSFDETLRPRTGEPGIQIRGRVVHFWRRESSGAWRIVMALTSRSAPDDPEA
jgi:ketosteroid isomerase-like protein